MAKKIFLLFTACVAFSWLSLSVAYADQLTLQPGHEDSKDNMIANSSYSNLNFGGPQYSYLEVFREYSFEGRSLLQFDIPLDKQEVSLESATLSLFMGGCYYAPFTVYANMVTSDWDSDTLTWNNQPAYTDSLQASSSLLGSYQAQTWVSFDMTQMCSYWLSRPDENYGTMLIADNPNHYACSGFYSSEIGNVTWRPKLVLNYSVTPEPVSMFLFGVGGISLALFRKRQCFY